MKVMAVMALSVVFLRPVEAAGQEIRLEDLPVPTSRDYAIDIYQGSVLGSVEIVGMGGVAVASAHGSAGVLFNPASAAVRPAESRGKWDWDFHADWLNPTVGSDFDNNQIISDTPFAAAPVLTAGLVGNYRQWALGVSAVAVSNEIDTDTGMGETTANSLSGSIVIARTFLDDVITAGLGARFGRFRIDVQKQSVFEISGQSLEAGGLWRPRDRNVRVGAAVSLPVTSDKVDVETCDPLNCFGLILPERANVPWRISTGVAWRRSEARWNQKVARRWRDEKYLLLAADLVLTGASPGGFGIEAFSRGRLQAAGRKVSVGLRAGAEYEWIPSWFRIRGGMYYEPARYRDAMGADIPGRPHLTVGFDARVWSFCFWRERYRLRLAATFDGADRYANAGISVGFWH